MKLRGSFVVWRLIVVTPLLLLLLGSGLADAQVINEPGFTSELVTTMPAFAPVGLAWAPDGRLFIWQKDGIVRVFKNGSLLATPFLDFSAKVNVYEDNGMWGLAFHPEFATNGFLYLSYVHETGDDPLASGPRSARLVRVRADPGQADVMLAGSEEILLDNLPDDFGTHTLGTIRFGADGTLFVGNGDGASPGFVDPNAWGAQDLDNPRGKIFRLNSDGTAPVDNPFYDGSDSLRSKVWCYGVRNPFRFSLHPESGQPYFADVGWNEWEEINRGERGGNYGWPCYEGTGVQSSYPAQLAQCAAVTSIPPIYEYSHEGIGTCIVGGDFYTGSQYPQAYRGNYFYADYSGNWIRRLVLDEHGDVNSEVEFATGIDGPVCLEQGPDGLLYYVLLASGQVRRIRFNGPTAVASAVPSYGYAPLTVSFSSGGSTNGGGGGLSYRWDFGDGTSSTQPNPTHVYSAGGVQTFVARLTVTNANQLTSSATVKVTIGSVPPVPRILAPGNGATVLPGQTVSYQGTASDAEDGVLPAAGLRWTVLLHHNSHLHTFVAGDGEEGSFVAENHGSVGSFSYEIVLTATDSSGLSSSTNVQVPVLADPVAPTAPSQLSAVGVSGTRVRLTWLPATDNAAVARYEVERCPGTACVNFVPVQTVAQTNYLDQGLLPTNSYRYRVRAVDASGNLGSYSETAGATTLSVPPPRPGLVAAYGFEEGSGTNLLDASGNHLDGTLAGVSWTEQGRFGNALRCNGAGFASIEHDNLLGLRTGMTLEAWVYPTLPVSGWRDILFKAPDIYYLMGSSDPDGQPATGGTFSSSPLIGTAEVPVDTWTHLASTYDGATLRLYVNGALVQSRAQTGNIRSSTGPLNIGGDGVYGQFWTGLIDEVRVYNRALSASELHEDMFLAVDGLAGNQPPVPIARATPTSGAAPLLVAFDGGSSFDPEGASLSYSWSFGDGDTSTLPNPTHTYSANGTFLARLTVSDGTNSTTSSDLTISISAAMSSLVAAYGFEEGAGPQTADASGLGNTGEINGATWTSAGRFGKGLSFDGDSAWVSINDASSLNLINGMTLEAWVYPTRVPSGWRDVVYKANDAYFLEASSGESDTPTFGGNFTVLNLNAPNPLPVNTWTHLAATYDRVMMRLYVNGVQVATQAQTGPIPPSAGPLSIGGNPIYGQFYEGKIDEVRIYNRALTAVEIQADLNTAVGSMPSNRPPTISIIPNQTTPEDVAKGQIGFTVADFETPPGNLAITARSSNVSLVPDANIALDGSGSNRVVTLMPATNQSGVATIIITVDDGQQRASSSFLLTVVPVNDPPTISAISNQTTRVGTTVGPLPFVVGDVETSASELTLRAVSTNPLLVRAEDVLFGGTLGKRTVTLTPLPDRTGLTTIELYVSDGALESATSFEVRVEDRTARLTILSRSASGEVLLRVDGVPGQQYLIEVSSDLTLWTGLAVVSDDSGVSFYTDVQAAPHALRFYRLVENP